MPRDWEAQFRTWATAPGPAELQKIKRAETQIRAAIDASPRLSRLSIIVFPQGSYRNRTNVPKESDVDICVRCSETFFYDFFPENEIARRAAAITPATYTYPDFKNDVESALVARFGRSIVKRGDKAFNVRESASRVEADAIATFEYRRYTGSTTCVEPTGTAFIPDSGGQKIINWPEQHYENGVAKNDRTRERFKAMTRVLKNLRNEMDDQAIGAAKPIPSYLVECLVFNVPDSTFGYSTYDELRECLRFIYHGTASDEACKEWREVNWLKYLLRGGQPWTRAAANAFAVAAWHYVGYGNS